jgi:hypothetical protein
LAAALAQLDSALPVGRRPRTVDELEAVMRLIALIHGEWVRLHPFANGNARTARLLAAFIALRYSLPVFVSIKPRPDDVTYARASKASMGRPPNVLGTTTILQRPPGISSPCACWNSSPSFLPFTAAQAAVPAQSSSGRRRRGRPRASSLI